MHLGNAGSIEARLTPVLLAVGTAKSHAPGGIAADGQSAGAALDNDEDIAAVAGTVTGSAQDDSAGAAQLPSSEQGEFWLVQLLVFYHVGYESPLTLTEHMMKIPPSCNMISAGGKTEALPAAVGPQPGAGGKLLLTVHDSAAGVADGAAAGGMPQLADDGVKLEAATGAGDFR